MKVMLIEDNKTKSDAISDHLKSRGISEKDIIHAKTMSDFTANLNKDIGLFIIDFNIPNIDNGAATKNGKSILETIIKAGKDSALLLAISSYPDDFPELRELFEAHGCILADFENKSGWQSTLDHLVIQLNKTLRLDFLIFCALHEERKPYIVLTPGKQVARAGIDCYDIEMDGKRGSVVLLPQMGLVSAAVVAGQCIDRFKPHVVAMSGICGGFKDRAQLGQLIVSTMAYEYQSGKWASDGFRQEPYQVPTNHVTLTDLKVTLNNSELILELEEGFRGKRPSEASPPIAGIFTSGSAVIADKEFMDQIQAIHRKVAALDMEIFAIHRAAELSSGNPPCICAKTVVDLCDSDKNDDIHLYGSYISAKFILKAIRNFFSKKPD